MNDAGYTLVETLAAMAVVSLAMGGLALGVGVLAPSQLATNQKTATLESLRAGQLRLEGLLARGAPFTSADASILSGDDRALRFACGAPQPCRAELAAAGGDQQLRLYDGRAQAAVITLAAPKDARLRYQGTGSGDTHWPPADPRPQALRSVALLASADAAAPALLEARVWREQPAACAFDSVSGVCR